MQPLYYFNVRPNKLAEDEEENQSKEEAKTL